MLGQSATATNNSVQVAVYDVLSGDKHPVEQVLVTVIKDPANPDEPWTVTSYRLDDESSEAFTMRHMEMVKAVRAALK